MSFHATVSKQRILLQNEHFTELIFQRGFTQIPYINYSVKRKEILTQSNKAQLSTKGITTLHFS